MKIITLILFIAVVAVSLSYLFSPAVDHGYTIEEGNYAGVIEEEKPYQPFALGSNNMLLESWTTYPNYNIGFGILSGIGFTGVILIALSINKEDFNNEKAD